MITVIVQAVTCCKQYHHFKLFQQSFKMKIMELSSGRKQTIRRQWWISRFEISKKEAGGRGSYFQQLLSVSLRSAMSFTMGWWFWFPPHLVALFSCTDVSVWKRFSFIPVYGQVPTFLVSKYFFGSRVQLLNKDHMSTNGRARNNRISG